METITRTVTATKYGYRVYGAFSCIMDIDARGIVIYSNMVPLSSEYAAMYKAYREFIKA